MAKNYPSSKAMNLWYSTKSMKSGGGRNIKIPVSCRLSILFSLVVQKGYIPKDYITILPPEKVGIEKYCDDRGAIAEAKCRLLFFLIAYRIVSPGMGAVLCLPAEFFEPPPIL
jgi:hypothetical protein